MLHTSSSTTKTVFILSLAFLLFLIPYYYLVRKRKDFNDDNADDDDDAEGFFINPCPNPNCVRCQKYKQVQLSAKRRLPHLIRHCREKKINGGQNYETVVQNHTHTSSIKRKGRVEEEKEEQIKNHNDPCQNFEFQLERVIDGVLNKKSHKNDKKNRRASGQHPTVLFIPRLSQEHSNYHGTGINTDTDADFVPSVVTHLHPKSCHSFLHNPSIRSIMLQEYINSQINNAQWTTNDVGTSNAASIDTATSMIPNTNNHNNDQLWEVLYLMNQGKWIHENIEKHCPKTFSFLSKHLVDDLMQNSIFGNIFISVLYPGTIIEPHCGPTNIRHRLHYALSVPDSKYMSKNDGKKDYTRCSPILKVRNEILKWEEGSVFVFDDSLVHSAEYLNGNDASEVRVVLVVDLWHPSLSSDERDLLIGLYPPM